MFAKSILIFNLLIIFSTVYGKKPAKIHNGETCRSGECSFVVSLSLRNHHFCGGSLVGQSHVLTAAHCVSNLTASEQDEMIVRSDTISSRFGGQEHRVRSIWYHSDYDSTNVASLHDIALIRLTAPVKFTDRTKWIRLASKPTHSDQIAMAFGWGYTENNLNKTSPILRKLEVTTLEPRECQNHLASPLGDGQICGLSLDGQGVCMGDSGGPLINEQSELIGDISWGIACAHKYPDVFTDVYKYRDWILDAMNEPY